MGRVSTLVPTTVVPLPMTVPEVPPPIEMFVAPLKVSQVPPGNSCECFFKASTWRLPNGLALAVRLLPTTH